MRRARRAEKGSPTGARPVVPSDAARARELLRGGAAAHLGRLGKASSDLVSAVAE